MGVTITSVKILGLCSKHRDKNDEISKNIHGEPYEDKDISCIACALDVEEKT